MADPFAPPSEDPRRRASASSAPPPLRPGPPNPQPYAPYALPPPAPAPAPVERPNLALATVVLAGAVLLVGAQVVQLVSILQDSGNREGSDIAMLIMASMGTMLAGIGLVVLGGWGTRSPGARAAFLIAGIYLLMQGGTFALLSGLFGFGRFG